MATSESGFMWVTDTLTPALKGFPLVIEKQMKAATAYHALSAVSYAKTNAPWNDITGAARQGIGATTKNGYISGRYEIELFHKMPYGIFLEVRFAGRYAIILSTIEHEAPVFFATAKDVFRRNMTGGIV